jgi:hypothetical protein
MMFDGNTASVSIVDVIARLDEERPTGRVAGRPSCSRIFFAAACSVRNAHDGSDNVRP